MSLSTKLRPTHPKEHYKKIMEESIPLARLEVCLQYDLPIPDHLLPESIDIDLNTLYDLPDSKARTHLAQRLLQAKPDIKNDHPETWALRFYQQNLTCPQSLFANLNKQTLFDSLPKPTADMTHHQAQSWSHLFSCAPTLFPQLSSSQTKALQKVCHSHHLPLPKSPSRLSKRASLISRTCQKVLPKNASFIAKVTCGIGLLGLTGLGAYHLYTHLNAATPILNVATPIATQIQKTTPAPDYSWEKLFSNVCPAPIQQVVKETALVAAKTATYWTQFMSVAAVSSLAASLGGGYYFYSRKHKHGSNPSVGLGGGKGLVSQPRGKPSALPGANGRAQEDLRPNDRAAGPIGGVDPVPQSESEKSGANGGQQEDPLLRDAGPRVESLASQQDSPAAQANGERQEGSPAAAALVASSSRNGGRQEDPLPNDQTVSPRVDSPAPQSKKVRRTPLWRVRMHRKCAPHLNSFTPAIPLHLTVPNLYERPFSSSNKDDASTGSPAPESTESRASQPAVTLLDLNELKKLSNDDLPTFLKELNHSCSLFLQRNPAQHMKKYFFQEDLKDLVYVITKLEKLLTNRRDPYKFNDDYYKYFNSLFKVSKQDVKENRSEYAQHLKEAKKNLEHLKEIAKKNTINLDFSPPQIEGSPSPA